MSLFLSNRDGVGADPSLTNEEGHYRMLSSLLSGGGDVLGNSVEVTQNSPLGMSVLIGTGDFKIDSGAGYAYMGWNSSNAVVTITTADPANPRIDAIVLYVDKTEDTQDSTPNNPGIIKSMAVAGTPNAVPTAPNNTAIQTAVGSGNPFIIIANVRVNAGVTQVTNANITDTRTAITLPSLFVNNGAIQDNAIATTNIQNLAVTEGKIANASVGYTKIKGSDWPRVWLYQTSVQTLASGGSPPYNIINWHASRYNVGSMWSAGTPNRINIPVTGIYLVEANVGFTAGSSRRASGVLVNGSDLGSYGQELLGLMGVSSATATINNTVALALTAGDYIQINVYQDNGSSLSSAINRTSVKVTLLVPTA